jgi:hypothetical protein
MLFKPALQTVNMFTRRWVRFQRLVPLSQNSGCTLFVESFQSENSLSFLKQFFYDTHSLGAQRTQILKGDDSGGRDGGIMNWLKPNP